MALWKQMLNASLVIVAIVIFVVVVVIVTRIFIVWTEILLDYQRLQLWYGNSEKTIK